MKQRPILFSAPMIRALLDGTKTQTRRVWKMPKGCCWYVSGSMAGEMSGDFCDGNGKGWWSVDELACPYGKVGDQLWVRETWGILHPQYINEPHEPTFWRADYSDADLAEQKAGTLLLPRWKPSIHMFRNRSRITLEITSVRVERLQDISQVEAMAEGAKPTSLVEARELDMLTYEAGYRKLWESINGAGSWDLNPWVWVLEFKRIAQI